MVNSTDFGFSDYHVDVNGLPDMDRYDFTEDERNHMYSLDNQLQFISVFEHLLSLKRGETTLISEEFMWKNLLTVRKKLTDYPMFNEDEREYLMLLKNCKHFVNEYNQLVKMKLVANITTVTNDLQFENVIDYLTPAEWFTPLPEVVEGVDYSWLDNYDDDAPMEIFPNQEHQQQEEQARENRRLLRSAIAAAKGDDQNDA